MSEAKRAKESGIKTILHHYVEIGDSSGIIKPSNEFTVKSLKVLGENERYMVVDSEHFQTIDKKPTEYSIGAPLGVAKISTSINDTCWGNRITYSLYSEGRKRASTIRKEIEKEIEKRFGFFARGIDLSIIIDKKEDGS